MHLSQNEDDNFSITKFESMLKTNDVLFFDSNEFEAIIFHYLESGKFALAKKAVKLGLEQHPHASVLQLFKVEILIFENKLTEADSLLNSLHDLEPSNEEVYIQKANIFSKRDNHKMAIQTLETALDFAPDAAEIYSLIAMEYMFMEDYDNAKYNFMKCLELEEEDFAALYNIIYCFDFLEQHQEAIDYLNMFLNKHPYCEVAWLQIGKEYFNLKDYEKALTAFDFAIISDEYFVGAYMEKGKVLEKLKRHQEAIENYMVTLELDDPMAYAYLRIGKCYEKLKLQKEALAFYEKAVDEDPLLDKAWIAITDFHLRKLDYQNALYYINKAISIDSENVLYWKRYAKINNRLNFVEEAEKGYRKTLELGNYELETWITRCDLLINLGEYETALDVLFQAIEFYPDTAEIEYRVAGLYFSLNEGEKGYYHLRRALKIDVEYSIIVEELFPMIFRRNSVQNLIEKYSQ